MTDRILIKQAAFAAAQGWNRSTVTRLKQAGRLVMEGALVDPVASLDRIRDTGGMRFDVAERHAAQRAGNAGKKTAAGSPAGQGEGERTGGLPNAAPAPDGAVGERRTDAQARKESALANIAEMEVEEKRKNLISWVDVEQATKFIGSADRAHVESMPDRLTPLLVATSDPDEIHAILSEWGRDHLREMADVSIVQAKAIRGHG